MTLKISGDITLRNGFQWNETVWNPSMLSPALWLDAADASTVTLNGSTVSQWRDKSGNSRHASQATAAYQPTYTTSAYNGKPGIEFDGTSDNLAVNYNYTGNQATVYAVVSLLAGGPETQWVFSSYGGLAGTPLVAPMWAIADQINDWGTYTDKFESGGVTLTEDGTPYALGLVSDISNSVLDAYTNGSRTAQIATSARFSGAGARNYIGAEVEGSNRYLKGRVSEIVQCEAVLPTIDRQKLEGYLAHKWGLTASLPAGHPYKTVGPTP